MEAAKSAMHNLQSSLRMEGLLSPVHLQFRGLSHFNHRVTFSALRAIMQHLTMAKGGVAH